MSAKLSIRQKIGYGIADFGASLTFVAINTWFLYFLTNIVGLGTLRAGIIFIVGRLFDAVIDPAMGLISDRTRSRFGRRLPFIWFGMLPLGISFALLWTFPEAAMATKFVLSLLAFMLFSTLYTVVQVPYLALTPELAPDYNERTNLTGFRIGFGTMASLLAVASPPLIIGVFDSAPDLIQTSRSAWLMMGIIFAVITVFAYFIMVISVREPKLNVQNEAVQNEAEVNLLAEYSSAFKIFGFIEVFVLFMLATLGLMTINSIMPFFLESALRLSADEQSIVLGTLFGVAILALPLWTAVATRLGKRVAMTAGLIWLSISATLLVLFAPQGLSFYLILMAVLAGIGTSAVILFPWAMLPDVVEFDELGSGKRREGLVYALFTFGQKVAGSLGVFANAIVATVFGYQQGVVSQSAQTVFGLKMMAGPVAGLVFLLAIIFALRFPITRVRHEEARAKLAQRLET